MNKRIIVALLVFILGSSYITLDASCGTDADSNEFLCRIPCSKRIPSCAPTPISRPTTITKPGCYCLTKDIVGQIIIDSSHVTLDLNCHVVDGGGSNNPAIIATGVNGTELKDIKIENGAIKNDGETGISMNFCNNVTLEKLAIHPVSVAIEMRRSDHVNLLKIRANHNTNTTLAIIFFRFCSDICFNDVEASQCIKNAANGNIGNRGIVGLRDCTNIIITKLRINNTEVQDLFEFGALFMFNCGNVTIDNSQFNNTIDTESNMGTPRTLLLSGLIWSGPASNNLVLKNSQVNNTRVVWGRRVEGITIIGDGAVLEGLQVNNTRLENAFPVNGERRRAGAKGIDIDDSSNNVVIRNCYVSRTEHGTNQNQVVAIASVYGPTGIFAVGNINNPRHSLVIEDCTVRDTQILASLNTQNTDNLVEQAVGYWFVGLFQVTVRNCHTFNQTITNNTSILARLHARGFEIQNCPSVKLKDCQVDTTTVQLNNTEGSAYGISFDGVPDAGTQNCVLEGCTANNQLGGINARGLSFELMGDITLKCCQTNGTSVPVAVQQNIDIGDGAFGIAVELSGDCIFDQCIANNQSSLSPVEANVAIGIRIITSGNVTLSACQAHDTIASGGGSVIGHSFGFFADSIKNCTLTDCQFIDQQGAVQAAGIHLDMFTGSAVMKCCQVNGTQVTFNGAFDCTGISVDGILVNNLPVSSCFLKNCSASNQTSTVANPVRGFFLDNLTYATLKCCLSSNTTTTNDNADGILIEEVENLFMEGCSANTVTANTTGDANGFHLTDVTDFTIKCCQATDIQTAGPVDTNDGHGFFLDTLSGRGLLSECVAGRAFSDGFRFDSVTDITIKDCLSKESGLNGFGFRDIGAGTANSGLYFENNIAQSNFFGYFTGAFMDFPTNIIMRANQALKNSGAGFFGSVTPSDWDDNYAKNPGAGNYGIVPINVYDKTAAGVYTLVQGPIPITTLRDVNVSGI